MERDEEGRGRVEGGGEEDRKILVVVREAEEEGGEEGEEEGEEEGRVR